MNKQSHSFINRRRLGVAAVLVMLMASLFLSAPRPVQAQTDVNQAVNNVLTPIWSFLKKAYEKGGASAFQKVVRTALNKIAYDTATWLGSGSEGQKPMFVTQGWGDYLTQIGDEAAGEFLEEAVNNWNNNDWDNSEATKGECQESYGPCLAACDPEWATGEEAVELAANQESCNRSCTFAYTTCLNKSSVDGGSVVTGKDGVQQVRTAKSVAVCQPSSISAKLNIAMGLVDYNRPQAPNCTASALVANWYDEAERLTAFKDDYFLDKFKGIFNPVSNDLGIYMSLRTDMTAKMATSVEEKKTKLIADGGWIDLQNIAGDIVGMPGDAETKNELATQGYISNMATFSGDALIDAANVFLNQLAMTAFNKFMSNLGKESSENSGSVDFTQKDSDPNIRYGETQVKESAASIIEPDFSVRADYDILSSLSMCRDRNNPGPAECVIDDKLMQGVTEKKTVAEAVKEGYLHKEWLFTSDYRDGAYNLRNIQIMRKYRLVPVGWEVAAATSKSAALIDLMSCFSATDAYNEYSANFDVRNQGWCRGLVDPNWVLKAPLNYCAKQGYSAQILNIDVVPEATSDGGMTDKVQITRAEDYCADEQTCIKEKSDGSCEAYGYCQSERRTWNFDSKSCQPIDNTCSAFVNSSSGQKVAYLENTLDYGDCSADSAGCKRYSLTGTYASSTGQMNWSENPLANAYFNSKLTDCSATDEGCKEVMRVKPGWGANLVMGADFANDNIGDELVNGRINGYWPVWSNGNRVAEIIDAVDLNGSAAGKAILLSSVGNNASTSIGLFSDNALSLIPADLNILSGETYTLSADVYLLDGDKVHAVLGSDYQAAVETQDKNVWRHLSVTRSLKDKPLSEMSFSIVGYSTGTAVRFAVRNLKLEMTSWDSGFSVYGAYKVYEKIIPPYLASACYINADPGSPDYRLRADAPSVCKQFARQCNRDEAGCERYTEASTGFAVAAQAVSSDYCDAACDGYDLYVARESYFYSPFAEKIIPENSQTCGAAAVGCSEFTNLDEVAAGGEGKEYYTQLKQCIKPSVASCADFYTWVGTEESGYQLKSLILKKDVDGNPAVTEDDSTVCNATIFNLPPTDPGFNADCRQFYNKAGQISYHLDSATITCSDNCHVYRLSENNIDTTVAQAQCSGSDRSWNASASVCYVCKNGGAWNAQYQSCLYQAIPQEGKTCAASQKGCREYNGSLGNNTKLLGAYSFENSLEGWEGQCGDDAVSSQVVNVNNGKSLLYDRGANINGNNTQVECDQQTNVSWLDRLFGSANAAPASFVRRVFGKSVSTGKAYTLKFTAMAASATDVSFAFLNHQDEIVYFNATPANTTGTLNIPGNNEWRTYELNLPLLDHEVDAREALIITATGDFYLDNLTVTEIRNRYYLIKGSSDVPDVCYYDMLDNYQGADYNLGCSLYNDRAGNDHYLRQFSRLCQDSAVGCELMVDTANYRDHQEGIWKDANNNGQCDSNEPECVSVAGDRFFYAIYDEAKRCNAADLGCSRLGEAVSAGADTDWSDVFKRNNPNNYDQSLCDAADAGCEAWKYLDGSGSTYFKNPGNNVCVYRSSTDPEKPGKAWYKVPVMRCDLNNNGTIDGTERNGQVCAESGDCPGDRSCLVDNNDYDCAVSYFETIGVGGGGNQVPVPSESAALCEAAASGCTEYIDPVSVFSANLIYNPAMENSNGWTESAGLWQQDVTIEPNKLYIFALDGVASSTITNNVSLIFDTGVALLKEDNNFSTSTVTTLVIPTNLPSQRFMFHSRGNTKARVLGGNSAFTVALKEAIIDYQFSQNIDKKSCNGLVNFDNGCVLFNERSVNGGSGLLSLSGAWNASASLNGQVPAACTVGNCSANQLVKVRPNRVCASWLDCLTYVVDPETNQRTCYALGECNRLNDNNECANFVKNSTVILASTTSDIVKRTGYSILDQYSLSGMKEVGLNTEAHYDFEAASPILSCRQLGSFDTDCKFNQSLAVDSIISSPNNAPTDYPAEGKTYLRVMASQQISPHSPDAPISVQQNQDYYVNYLVNTKGSGLSAKVWIYSGDSSSLVPIATHVSSSPNGWERKVFKISGSNLNVESIRIYLGADTSSTDERYVYFDDVNIEPVLQVADDSYTADNYVAKECRLYPSQDAISCTSKNSQVVSDGLVGYCLQHDQANKNVCLLWYPIDQISAAGKSSRSALGYQGAFPLNYCTEANGNFSLVKKKLAYYRGVNDEERTCHDWDCFYPSSDSHCQDDEGFSCPQGYKLFSSQYQYNDNHDDRCHKDFWCIPHDRHARRIYIDEISQDTSCTWANNATWWIDAISSYRMLVNTPGQYVNGTAVGGGQCGYTRRVRVETEGWYVYDGLFANEAKNANPAIRVYDYNRPTDDEDQLKLFFSSDTDKVYYPTCNKFVQLVDAAGNNKAWVGRTSKSSYYPYETPLFFRSSTNYFGSACYIPNGGECIEYCSCDNRCDCIHGAEDCEAPCNQAGDCYARADVPADCSAPGAVLNPNAFNLSKYGRNRDSVPFGAATFPDDFNIFNSEAVKFRTQYSDKIDQEVFAGRPYGCVNGQGTGCASLGYCSLNPQVICLLDTTTSSSTSLVNQKSCGSANGTCVPLWNSSGITSVGYNSDYVLQNIFWKSFSGYKINAAGNSYILGEGYSSVIDPAGPCANVDRHLSPQNDGTFNNYWCLIYPRINNVKLINPMGALASSTPAAGYNVSNPGIYTLSFNSTIDTEQQPMKDLIIDWGDGSLQSLVNQDHHPETANPHKVYHYYKGDTINAIIRIKVSDNWGTYCCSRNGDSCSNAVSACPGN